MSDDNAAEAPVEWGGLPSRDRDFYAYSMDGKEPYELGPDSLPKDGAPKGTVTPHREFGSTFVYPETSRTYSVYVPAQYDPVTPACLMVFQDGDDYAGPVVNVPTVFDNLIASGEMPVTIALFVNPGNPGPGAPVYGGRGNRNVEYDNCNADYATFLAEELIPVVAAEYTISSDPEHRAICGISSGGACSFTAGWFRPDQFRKIVSHCGSFLDIIGAHQYPSWIRRQYKRPLKVYLQTGEKDLDIKLGHIPLANREMEAALRYRGYDVHLEFGEGGHTLIHGGALFPDTMRWLWSDVV
ncbi:esterase family protein [Actinoplanes bogorensis]|uniref:Esterase family protein n=1 Tax=Paractinoplanes bogorensis TaxID=1610840 RepID=A0ABS5YKW8_9ACTN|nr:alpha/beta hydrolase-fold protein [Actinoplanes bogorensis]MBU2664100.1 esterase family protein [Actinoplanes bogorensis]